MKAIVREKPNIVEFKDGEEVFGQAEEITSRALGAEGANLARITLTGPDVIHVHKKAEESYIYESGMGKILLGDQISEFGPGTRVIIPPGTPHAVKPGDSFPRVIFLCISGPPFDPEDVYPDPRGRNW